MGSDEALEEPFEEGGFRMVALGEYVAGPREGQPCVAKWLKSGYTMSEEEYADDIRCAVKALQIVREFNSEDIVDTHVLVNIPEVCEFGEDSVLAGVFYLQEPFIDDYDKCMCFHLFHNLFFSCRHLSNTPHPILCRREQQLWLV